MISAKNLNYVIKKKRILTDISFEIEEGEYVYLLGVSGSGKTTLLNLLGGLIPVTSGEICIKGISNKSKEYRYVRKELISYVMQDFGLLLNKSVKDNVLISLEIIGKTLDESEFELYVKKLSLQHVVEQKCSDISSGQKQRVKILQAILRESPIILFDEPTSSLDVENEELVIQCIERLNENGTTIIHSTHKPHVIKEGRKIIKL